MSVPGCACAERSATAACGCGCPCACRPGRALVCGRKEAEPLNSSATFEKVVRRNARLRRELEQVLVPQGEDFTRVSVFPYSAATLQEGVENQREQLEGSGSGKAKEVQGRYRCPVRDVSVKSEEQIGRNAGISGYSSAASALTGVMQHSVNYGGLSDVDQLLFPSLTVSAQLLDAQQLPFRPAISHFFSCTDGRARYAVMGAPGGDMGELLLALSALEKLRPGLPKLDEEQVLFYFQDYLEWMVLSGKQRFYHHSDKKAMMEWGKAAGVKDPLTPMTPEERDKIISLSAEVEHQGCSHLQLLLQRGLEVDYGVRSLLAQHLIKAFWTVFFDSHHPMKPKLLFVALEGEHEEEGWIHVDRNEDYPCGELSPLVVPNRQGKQFHIHHRAAVSLYRAEMAEWLHLKLPRKERKNTAVVNCFGALQAAGERTMRATVSKLPQVPNSAAAFSMMEE